MDEQMTNRMTIEDKYITKSEDAEIPRINDVMYLLDANLASLEEEIRALKAGLSPILQKYDNDSPTPRDDSKTNFNPAEASKLHRRLMAFDRRIRRLFTEVMDMHGYLDL